jgi:hypothetical protein
VVVSGGWVGEGEDDGRWVDVDIIF